MIIPSTNYNTFAIALSHVIIVMVSSTISSSYLSLQFIIVSHRRH